MTDYLSPPSLASLEESMLSDDGVEARRRVLESDSSSLELEPQGLSTPTSLWENDHIVVREASLRGRTIPLYFARRMSFAYEGTQQRGEGKFD